MANKPSAEEIERVLSSPPANRTELKRAIRVLLGVTPASAPLIEGHHSPFDYLAHTFFHGSPSLASLARSKRCSGGVPRGGDCVVWANRGGGKTFYAAVATALDLLYKPGVEIKLIAGSREQSARMFAHLSKLFTTGHLADQVEGKISAGRLVLTNGSNAEILSQSHASVRGMRPQIVRCDEVELFDRSVWEAIQFAPHSKRCGSIFVPGTIEALSTWHIPLGLMSELVEESKSKSADAGPQRKLFRWGVVDVLHRCPASRACESCELLPECEIGRASCRERV